MKKIISTMVVVFLLLSSGCSVQNPSSTTSSSVDVKDEKVDIMSEALSLAGLSFSEEFNSQSFPENSFEDAKKLYENPLTLTEYVMSYKTKVEKMADLKTATDFIEFVLSENTYKLKSSSNYRVYDDINDSLTETFNLFGTTEGLQKAKDGFENVEPRVAKAISHFLSASLEAYKIISEQTKDISTYDFYKCQQFLYCPPQSEGDRQKAFDEVLDICKNVDAEKMLNAFSIMLSATKDLRQGIRFNNNLTENGKELVIDTPLGAICLGTNGDDVYRSPCALLIIDLNGNDEYLGKIAANSSLSQPISVVIDLGGDDIYDNNGYTATQGSGILGVGILFDNNGNDSYSARAFSQGACLFGGGALVDLMGNDSYQSAVTSQSAGYFGSSFLIDLNGNDEYTALGYSQGFAGEKAVCLLTDKNGNDNYMAEPIAQNGYEDMKLEEYEVAANFSQGCGIDGGVAGLIDLSGYDEYKGSAWVQGVAKRGGIGFLSDYQGGDMYFSNCNSKAAAEDFGIGAVLDVGGNDSYVVSELDADGISGQSLGYARNGGIAQFIDDFGNDFYYTHHTSLGTTDAQNVQTAYAVFVDTEGEDAYYVLNAEKSLGYGKGAIFIDGNGTDRYNKTGRTDGEKLFGSDRNNGVFWDIETAEKPEKDQPEYEFAFLTEAKDKHFS